MKSFFFSIRSLLKATILVVALYGFQAPSACAQVTLKVLSYNVKHGFEQDSSIMQEYFKWVKEKIRPDVVLYQEMNGFTRQSLAEFAAKYGHSFSVILNDEGGYNATHPLVMTSRYPIENVEMRIDSMWHGYIMAKIQGIYFFVTHMAPFTLLDRRADVARILERIKQLPDGTKVLVAGDFNALARVDAANYGADLLKSMRRIEGRLEPKSGTAIVKFREIYRNNLDNNEIDYSVTDAMLNAGLIDVFYSKNKRFDNSVPTKAYQNKNSKLRRIDYIWSTPLLFKKIQEIDIVKDRYTDKISDHYPVVVTIGN